MSLRTIESALMLLCLWSTTILANPALQVLGSDSSQAGTESRHHLYVALPESVTQDSYFPYNLKVSSNSQSLLIEDVKPRREHQALEVLFFVPSAWQQEDPAQILQQIRQIPLPEGTLASFSWDGDWESWEDPPEQIRVRQEPFPQALRRAIRKLEVLPERRRVVVLLSDALPLSELDGQQVLEQVALRQSSLFVLDLSKTKGPLSPAWDRVRIPADSLPEGLRAWEQLLQKLNAEWTLTYQNPHWNSEAVQVRLETRDANGSAVAEWEVPALNSWPTPKAPLVSAGAALILALLGVGGLWHWNRPRQIQPEGMGFLLLNPKERGGVIDVSAEGGTLEFLTKIRTRRKLRLSANLHRVILTPQDGTLLLEDKNYKNALLINRRRSHRRVLQDGDLLDVGEMVLLFLNPKQQQEAPRTHSEAPGTPVGPKDFLKPNGPVRKQTPTLQFPDIRNDFPLVRNVVSIGRSHLNDLRLNNPEVSLRHAKIVKVGGQYKLVNLAGDSTLVNGRRVEQRFLREGDEVTIGDCVFRFRVSRSGSRGKGSRAESSGSNRTHENV